MRAPGALEEASSGKQAFTCLSPRLSLQPALHVREGPHAKRSGCWWLNGAGAHPRAKNQGMWVGFAQQALPSARIDVGKGGRCDVE